MPLDPNFKCQAYQLVGALNVASKQLLCQKSGFSHIRHFRQQEFHFKVRSGDEKYFAYCDMIVILS